jgi:hypothetical protein
MKTRFSGKRAAGFAAELNPSISGFSKAAGNAIQIPTQPTIDDDQLALPAPAELGGARPSVFKSSYEKSLYNARSRKCSCLRSTLF